MGLCCRWATYQPWCSNLDLPLLSHAYLVVSRIKKTGAAVYLARTKYADARMLRSRKLGPSPGRSIGILSSTGDVCIPFGVRRGFAGSSFFEDDSRSIFAGDTDADILELMKYVYPDL